MLTSALSKTVEAIVRQAGKRILSYRNQPLERVQKHEAGFVTEADRATEDFLVAELAKLDSSTAFFTEENGASNAGSSDYCWVIDPLDGTTNFTYGLPHFCVSVALTYKQQPIMGWVYQPLLDEMFVAERGKGAFVNGSRIKVSKVQRIEDAFLLFCIPYAKNEGSLHLFDTVLKLSQTAYSMRLLGAAALDQAYVAAARFDGMFFEQLQWWDVAAGLLIVEEAGGKVSDYAGNALQPHFTSFVAGNPWIHEHLIRVLAKNAEGIAKTVLLS